MAENVKSLLAPFLEKGFAFEYLYQKGGDSSCVYICRFKKGKDFVDWREVSGGDEITAAVLFSPPFTAISFGSSLSSGRGRISYSEKP